MLNGIVKFIENGAKPDEVKLFYDSDGIEWEMKIYKRNNAKRTKDNIEKLELAKGLLKTFGY